MLVERGLAINDIDAERVMERLELPARRVGAPTRGGSDGTD